MITYLHEYYNNLIMLLHYKFDKNDIIQKLFVDYCQQGEIMIDEND